MTYLTRFRAYQLESAGSLFSYYKPGQFTLIEARIPKGGINVLKAEMQECGVDKVDVLHVTSWDTDHMKWDDLIQILNQLRPNRIEVPDYQPESDEGKRNKRIIDGYDEIHSQYVNNVQYYSAAWIAGLQNAPAKGTSNIVWPSKYDGDNKNDKSLIKFFRSNGFNVASFGDCESKEISDRVVKSAILRSEMDIMILAHHGAANGFTNEDFLGKTKPIIAVALADYDNQYGHPKDDIKEMLHRLGIRLFTTKTGDVVVFQEESGNAIIFNLMSDNQAVSSKAEFIPKRLLP